MTIEIVATDYGPGVGWPEIGTHTGENRGDSAVEISVDIVR
jgi:hypothetical protein